jgi:hypothetical protein
VFEVFAHVFPYKHLFVRVETLVICFAELGRVLWFEILIKPFRQIPIIMRHAKNAHRNEIRAVFFVIYLWKLSVVLWKFSAARTKCVAHVWDETADSSAGNLDIWSVTWLHLRRLLLISMTF